jgi:hypothetical protein
MDREKWKIWGAVGLLRLIGRTLRIETQGESALDLRRSVKGPFLYAFYHGSLFPLVYVHRNQGVCILSSLSRDGEFLSRILLRMGYQVVRGSSSRGGMRGLLELARALEKGGDGAIAVDGPRGPRYQVKPGIVFLSAKTGVPIIPIGVGFSRAKRFLKSWDEFRLPYPFSRVVLCYGHPIAFKEDSKESVFQLSRALETLTEKATQEAGSGY